MSKGKASDTTQAKHKGTQNLIPWQPGQSGNPAGRPKSSRNKLTEDFLSAVAEDFEKHGKEALKTVREEDPSTYLRVVAQIIPKESELTVKADDAFVNLWQKVSSGALAELIDKLEQDVEARH
jgi:hypothetical protein